MIREFPARRSTGPAPGGHCRGLRRAAPGWPAWLAALVLCVAASACGKKGPPLAPIVHVPAAVDHLAAQRIGNEIYLSITIPTQNIDASTPADVDRIDVFAVTSTTPPPRARMLEFAARVASIGVQPAAPPGDAAVAAPAPAATDPPLPVQGATATVREQLTTAELRPTDVPAAAPDAGRASAADGPARTVPIARRYYMAVAQSDRGRQGPPGAMIDVPLLPLPEPPGSLRFTYTQDDVTVSWEPSGGIVGFLLEKPLPREPAPVDQDVAAGAGAPGLPDVTLGPTRYNVYRELGPTSAEGAAGPAAPRNAGPPVPINAEPIDGLTYTDSAELQLGRERCYTVRALRGSPPAAAISVPSERACLTPEDVFPPQAPTGLSAIAGEGAISLLWEPNGEADLAGYVVLRGRAGDATLQRLTETAIMATSYTDRDVMPGVRYVYAVQAVDTHVPAPNASAESARVEETAR